MWHMGNGWGWGMFVIIILAILFLAIIFWGTDRVTRQPPPGGTPPIDSSGPNAMEILRRRYANGEITREEFETMRDVLARSGPDRE